MSFQVVSRRQLEIADDGPRNLSAIIPMRQRVRAPSRPFVRTGLMIAIIGFHVALVIAIGIPDSPHLQTVSKSASMAVFLISNVPAADETPYQPAAEEEPQGAPVEQLDVNTEDRPSEWRAIKMIDIGPERKAVGPVQPAYAIHRTATGSEESFDPYAGAAPLPMKPDMEKSMMRRACIDNEKRKRKSESSRLEMPPHLVMKCEDEPSGGRSATLPNYP